MSRELASTSSLENFGVRWSGPRLGLGRDGIRHSIVCGHYAASFPALYTNSRAFGVSFHIGRKGSGFVHSCVC